MIYASVMYKARASGIPPMRAYEGENEQAEALYSSHPLSLLVSRPHPSMSWRELQMLATIYLNVTGNHFAYVDRPAIGEPPTAIWPLRPDRVFIIPGQGGIKGYAYVPEQKSILHGFPILPQDMIHVKFPNPSDPYEGMGYGLSPIAPMARSGDVDNMITSYLKLFFQNGAMPPGYITYKAEMEGDDMAKAKARWMEVYGGYENWTEVAVLDNSGEYKQAGLTFDEMGFDSLDERNEARMTGPFGVPPALIYSRLGLENATYSNIEELRRVFWEDTMLHEIRLFQEEYQYFLNIPEQDVFVAYDLSTIPALKRDLPPLVSAAYQLWQMGVPANDAFEALNVPVGEIPGGEISYLPIGVVPAGSNVTSTARETGTPTAEEDDRDGKAVDRLVDRLIAVIDDAAERKSPKAQTR